MKIVIDIDNETYGRIQALVNADYFEHDICGYSMQRIANGTPYEPRGEGKCVTCKYRACWVTENPCRECSRSYANLYEEAEND